MLSALLFAYEQLSEPVVTFPIPSPEPTFTATSSADFTLYEVDKVVDGDTIRIFIDGKSTPVRIVGIDTPETVDPRRPVECMGKEASDRMKELISGKKVRLEVDASQSDRDKYDRLLRFVFLEDGTDVGLKMIEEGFAQSNNYGSTTHKYFEAYEQAEMLAESAGLGLWNRELCPEG